MALNEVVASFLEAGKQREKERRKRVRGQAALLAKMNGIYSRHIEPDWSSIIEEILNTGIPSVGLSISVGKCKSWADNYMRSNTSKMDYKIGVALLAIHRKFVK